MQLELLYSGTTPQGQHQTIDILTLSFIVQKYYMHFLKTPTMDVIPIQEC